MERKSIIFLWVTSAQRKYSTLDCNFLFWVQRNCWCQCGICQPQDNLKTSTPTESTNVVLGGSRMPQQCLSCLGWVVYDDKEKEMCENALWSSLTDCSPWNRNRKKVNTHAPQQHSPDIPETPRWLNVICEILPICTNSNIFLSP